MRGPRVGLSEGDDGEESAIDQIDGRELEDRDSAERERGGVDEVETRHGTGFALAYMKSVHKQKYDRR